VLKRERKFGLALVPLNNPVLERSEVYTAVKMMTMFFWVLAPCGLIGRCQHFHTVSTSALKMETVVSELNFDPESATIMTISLKYKP
jgi:hypothetical protein